MSFPPVIETDRLVFTKLGIDDAAVIFESFAQDIEVARYVTWTPRQSVRQVEEFIVERQGMWEQGKAYAWSLRNRNGQLVGMIEGRIDHHRLELGYVLARAFWGQGLATEAVARLVEAARAEPSITCVWAYVDVDNVASSRVLEKAGLTAKGIMESYAVHPNISDEPRDCLIHSLRIKDPK